MGSFTSLSAREVIRAIFPIASTNLAIATNNITALTASLTNASSLKIYTNSTSSTFGIFSGNPTADVVRHRVDLIQNSAAVITAIPDSYIGLNGFTTAGSTANYQFANYTGYQGMCTVNSPTTGNHAWLGWSINGSAEPNGTWKVVTDGQIGFPQSTGTTSVTIHGFIVSSATTSTNASVAVTGTGAGLGGQPTNTSTLLATAPGTSPIIAYGDLSSVRTVATNDTPVFTSGAIVITLD